MSIKRETTSLPRTVKRSLGLGMAHGFIKDKHHYGDIKRGFIQAQNHYIEVKNRRPSETDA